MTHHNDKPNNLNLGEVPEFFNEREVGCEKDNFLAENHKYLQNGEI